MDPANPAPVAGATETTENPRIIVKYRRGADPENVQRRVAQRRGAVGRGGVGRAILAAERVTPVARAVGLDRLRVVEPLAGQTVEETIAAYADDPDVEYAELDATLHLLDTIPTDPLYSSQWGLAEISAPQVWDVEQGSPSIVVAVIDSGIDLGHPDLIDNLWVNPGEIPGNDIDDDGNGFVDDVHGYDFLEEDGDPADDHGHGTHVSGTIGAVGNNGVGVVGVNWQTRIMVLRFAGATGRSCWSTLRRESRHRPWPTCTSRWNTSWSCCR